jgi:hypothetical protein
MTRTIQFAASVLALLPKAILVMLVVAAPVLAMPGIRGVEEGTIDAPKIQKTGAGFVLLVSLQRS